MQRERPRKRHDKAKMDSMGKRVARLEEVEALRESADRLRILFESAPDAYYLSDVDGVLIDVNEAAETLFAYEKHELIGTSFLDLGLFPSLQVPQAKELLTTAAGGKPTGPDTLTLCRKDGRNVEVEMSAVPVEIDGTIRILGTARDVTGRKKMMDALRESEERYQRAASAGRVGVWEWDLRSNEMYLDPKLKALLGYEEREIRDHMDDWARHVHPDDTDKVGAAVEPCLDGRASTFDVEHRMLHKDGSIRWFLGRGTVVLDGGGVPVRMVGSDVDITEHKRMQEQRRRLETETRLLQSQKLESLGVLAGGVAHDFNNMLTSILANASLALSRLESDSPAHELVRRIEEGALRASELTSQLLAYSGKGRFLVEPLSLNELAGEMVHLLDVSISKKARLRLELSDEDPVIEGDASQIRQVIMNLVLNASDSVQGVGGGQITIVTGSIRITERPSEASREALSPGNYAVLAVSDEGEGMDEDTRSQVFEPFFTTKAPGRGLGLAAVQGIVRGHKGTIELESQLRAGTTVRVLFPETLQRPRSSDGEVSNELGSVHDSQTVLVVDDERSVREVAIQILEDSGYRVLSASDGATAVRTFRERSDEIDAVLLDLTMPDIDGDVVIQRMRAIQTDARVILMSGYDEQRSVHRLREVSPDGFVKKPFRPQELVRALHRCLSSGAEAATGDSP